jgi:type I restriction enzyme S subunit
MVENKYENTDLDYLPKFPSHWKLDRIKDKTTAVVGGDWGRDPDSDADGQNIIVLRVADLDGRYFDFSDLTIRRIKDSSLSSRQITERSLMIEKSGGGEKQTVGRVGMPKGLSETAICSNFMAKIDFDSTVDLRFVNYLFHSLYNAGLNFPFVQQTTGIQNLNVGYYLTTLVAFPPLPEQRAIADYLDRATEKINRVIAIKERQLELIDQQLSSRLSEVISKGIKNEELKESGIHWMPFMPKNWKRQRLKDVVSLKSGNSITSDDIFDVGEFPVYGGNGLRGYTDLFTHEGCFALIGRQGALCGNINYAEGKFWASEHAVVATPIHKCDIVWIGELMRAMNLNQYSNAAAQPGLAVERIKQLYIPYPDYSEQNEISDFIMLQINRAEKLKENLTKQITSLQSYRQSLIHECVTGKKRVVEEYKEETTTEKTH